MPFKRTFLFAPGNHARRVEQPFTLGADAVILDLEDSVAVSEKRAARKPVAEVLARNAGKPRRCRGCVRVNAMGTPLCFRDPCEVVGKGVDGVVLPKSVPPRRRCGCSRDPARWTGNRLPDRLSGRAPAPGRQG